MDQTQIDHLKGAIESLLFVSEKPISVDQLREVCQGAGSADIQAAVSALQKGYTEKNAGMVIVEIAGGFQMLSNSLYAGYIRNFYKTRHKEKLSRPALETLAIVAYKQPVSRGDIELIRGVNSDGVVVHLLDKSLIKMVGRKDIPGRPYLYGTTKEFLEYFGLRSLKDLPKLEDFPALQASMEEAPAAPTAPENNNELATAAATPPSSEENFKIDEAAGGSPGAPENFSAENPLPTDVRNLKEIMDEMNEERAA